MKNRFLYNVILVFVVLLIQASCTSGVLETSTPTITFTSHPTQSPSSLPTSTTTLTPVPTSTISPTATSTPVPTSTLSFAIPSPATGTGAILGLVRWNNKPVAKAAVKLCEEFNGLNCSGNEYSANSNSHGYYLFKNVKPGSYIVLVNSYYSRWWIYQTDMDGFKPRKEKLDSNQTLIVDPIDIYKVDLNVSQPAQNEKISNELLAIKWDEYPDAAYYTVIFQDYGGRLITKTVEKNEYEPEEPLMDCSYNVTVEAYTDEDIKIAENGGGLDFIMDNEPEVSCMMSILWPPTGNNASTLLGPEMELGWDKHPLASYYYISLVSSGGEIILDNVKLDKDQNHYLISLHPGYYTWEVISYDQSGEELTRTGNLFGIRWPK